MSTKHRSRRDAFRAFLTIPGVGKDTAAIVAMVIGAAVAVIFILVNLATALPWQKTSEVKAEFESLPGVNINAGAPVTIAGVRMGQIVDAEVSDRATAIVTLQLNGEQKVYSNARAVLRPKNPLNEMSIEINPGGPPGSPLGTEDVLPLNQTARPIQADEVLQPLDGRAQAALTDLLAQSDVALVRAPQDLAPGLDATTNTATAVRPVVEALKERRVKIAQLVTSISQIAGALGQNTERTAQLADGTERTLGTLAANDAALRSSLAQLPGLTGELRDALTKTQDLTKQLNPTLDNLNRASEELPDALDNLRDISGPLKDTVDAAVPVAEKARPVFHDLRPAAKDLDEALDDFLPVTEDLKGHTKLVTDYLTELAAFMYNTKSVFAAGDATSSVIRGHYELVPGYGFLPQKGFSPDRRVNPGPKGEGNNGPLPDKVPGPRPDGGMVGPVVDTLPGPKGGN